MIVRIQKIEIYNSFSELVWELTRGKILLCEGKYPQEDFAVFRFLIEDDWLDNLNYIKKDCPSSILANQNKFWLRTDSIVLDLSPGEI